MGINAMGASVLKCILAQAPLADVQFVDYSAQSGEYKTTNGTREVSIPLVNIASPSKFYLQDNIAALVILAIGLKLLPKGRTRNWLVARQSVLRHVAATDLAVSFAEGDSFSDIYGVYRFLRMVLPLVLFLVMGKRLVLLPQTIGPFKSRWVRWIAAFILRSAEAVYSRDRAGTGEAGALIGPKLSHGKARFCYDVAFVLDPSPPHPGLLPSMDGFCSRPLVGLNVSGLLSMGGYTGANMFGLKAEYMALIRAVIDEFIIRRHASLILVPHVFGSSPESDVGICADLYRDLHEEYGDRLLLAAGDYNQHEIKYLIGQCDFFVGSRMHSCIAAMSQCVPTVSIAYSRKFIGVMEATGFGFLVADARKLSAREVVLTIGEIYDRRSQIAQELRRGIPLIQQTVLNLFSGVIAVS